MQEAKIGTDKGIPHISAPEIVKYITDLEPLDYSDGFFELPAAGQLSSGLSLASVHFTMSRYRTLGARNSHRPSRSQQPCRII